MQSILEAKRQLIEHASPDASLPQKKAAELTGERDPEELQPAQSLKTEEGPLPSQAPLPSPIVDGHPEPGKAKVLDAGRKAADVSRHPDTSSKDIPKEDLPNAKRVAWTMNLQSCAEIEADIPVPRAQISTDSSLNAETKIPDPNLQQGGLSAAVDIRVKT